jgi:hypothetical protein
MPFKASQGLLTPAHAKAKHACRLHGHALLNTPQQASQENCEYFARQWWERFISMERTGQECILED